jgi:succinate dehydrogenase / fumarate reductase cytochrome b subunit
MTAATHPIGLTTGARGARGAVAQKVTMALTGLVLVGYIVTHVLANLLSYAGPEWINGYGALLHATGPLLWVARGVLLVAAALHVNAAVRLARAAREARGHAYARHERGASSYATRTIRWGGALLFVYLLVHVPMFTAGALHPAFVPGDDYQNVVRGFRVPWIAALNLAAALVTGMHVHHGVRSAAASLGAPLAGGAARVVRGAGLAIALLVGVGFASLPIAVVLGLLGA